MFIRTFNTKSKLSSKTPQKYHNAYGIQSWLVKKKYCMSTNSKRRVDKDKYKELLLEFYGLHNSNKPRSIVEIEAFVQENFQKFCNYVLNLNKKLPK